MKLLISQRAMDDLACIWAWQAVNFNETTAELFKSRVEAAFDLLRRHPEAGPHPAWATRHSELRFWVISHTRYLVFYEFHGRKISIERVLDGRRDVQRIIKWGQEYPPSVGE
jgi:plasmid stabilization system protein ParE